MPMIDIQRRHAEVFRIRLGDKGPKGEPRKLTEQIRVTASGVDVVQAFVDVYGGQVIDFNEDRSRHRFQAYLPTTTMSVLVLPGHSVSQWWEKYKGSVCERRCDGMKEQKSGKRCLCPEDIDERVADRGACSPTTRVNVLCPDVAVAGSGALVTHGLIAAETLPQSIAVAEAALSRGLMVPAVLRIVEHKGRNHFIVPQIEIVGISLNELTTGERPSLDSVSAPVVAIGTGRPRITPVPDDLPEPPVPSVIDQVTAVENPRQRPARSNAQVPLPATGLRPGPQPEKASEDDHRILRTAIAALEDDAKTELVAWWNEHRFPNIKDADVLTKAEVERAFDFLDAQHTQRQARAERAAQVAEEAGLTERAAAMREKVAAGKPADQKAESAKADA